MARLDREDSGGKKPEFPDAVGEFNERIRKAKAEKAEEERRNGKPIDVKAKVVSDELNPEKKVEFEKVDDRPVIVTPPKDIKSHIVSYAVIVAFLGVVAFLFGALLPFLILVMGIIIFCAMIWFILAPNNIVWNFTSEATAKVVVRGDSPQRIFIQWRGYTLDEDWNVVKENENHKEPWHFGGLRFNGVPLLDEVYEYSARWKSIRLQPEEKGKQGEMVKYHEEILDFVALRFEVYYIKIYGAETMPPERLSLDVEFITTLQVFNPYKVLFVAPYNWLENVMTRLSALYTNWVGTKTLDEILEVKEDEAKLWEEIGGDELINKTLIDWGIRVADHGVQVRRVDMPSDYQTAIAEEKKQKLKAAGRSAETIGTVLATIAYARGKTIEDIQKEIDGNPEKQKEFLEMAVDLITRKIAIEGGSYLDIRTEGAEGLEKTILNALSAWQRMPKGKTP